MSKESTIKEIRDRLYTKDGEPTQEGFNNVADWHEKKIEKEIARAYSVGWTHCADQVRDVLDE